MRIAKSARTKFVLGATLVATTLPAMAERSISATKSINGRAAVGIDGGANLGIDGGAFTGIDGGAVLGVDGGAVNGIDGGAVLGIDGGAVTGIDGGAVLGIDGGAITGIDGGAVLGIDGGAVTGISGAVLTGPVDKIDTTKGIFESMGQSVMASQAMLDGLTVGDLVAVEGSIVASGWIYADVVAVSSEPYVAGATEVSVTGLLSSIDLEQGTARIGALTVDYSASLSLGREPTAAIWSFSGTRPVSKGVMLSDRSRGQ